jgi:hypothetical protein
VTRRPAQVTVTVLRWTAELTGPPAPILSALRAAVGDSWSTDRGRVFRITADRAAEVVDALWAAGTPVVVNGELPAPELWEGGM